MNLDLNGLVKSKYMSKKKILIISGESWRDESNGGNVLSNLFGSFTEDYEFAQIFTNPNLPSNKICTKYFHISEGEVVKAFLKNKPFGYELNQKKEKEKRKNVIDKVPETNMFSVIKKIKLPILYTIQDFIWRFSKWKTPELKNFILDYNPDIIFAPMYYSLFLHRIDRYVAELTHKKLISYVSDDHLTFRHFSLSPFFWFNRFFLRKNVIATSKYYSLLYTMTDEQMDEYQEILKVPMKVLKKSADFDKKIQFKKAPNKPIKMIYGGNLIYNRYKTLGFLASVLRDINKDGVKIELDIYTQTPISNRLKRILHDGKSSFLKGKVSMRVLNEEYSKADIVLHVESFDLKQRLITRLSFSTKIIDLFHSAKCILAICWEDSSPFRYLKKEDAAICISDVKKIKEELLLLINDPKKIKEYSLKSWECGLRNHNFKEVNEDFKNYFDSNIKGTKQIL